MYSPKQFQEQGESVRSLLEQIHTGRMVHALLISGEAGTGKWSLAQAIASALLCQGEGEKPCGKCRACLQMENLEHPDLIVLQKGVPISPEIKKPRANIPVDDIREMIRRTSVHALEGNDHVVIIRHAEDMGHEAQNALLKTLEEPPEGTFFLLTCIRTNELLPTIISRCRPLKMHSWSNATVMTVLREHGISEDRARHAAAAAHGSIGAALKTAQDESYWKFRKEVISDFLECPSRSEILKISTKWKDRKGEADALFSILEEELNQMLHRSLGQVPEVKDTTPERWKKFAAQADTEKYTKLFDGLLLARKRTAAQVNFQAVTEQVILMLMEAIST